MVGFTMLIPDVQFRARELGAEGYQIGLILTSTFIVQTIFSPIWSKASDRVGRKKIFLMCSLFSAIGMGLYAISDNLFLMLVCRVFAGIGAANVAVEQAMISGRTTEDERAKAISHFIAVMMTGLLIGPVLGGFAVGELGRLVLGCVAGGLSLLGLVWVALAIPADQPPGEGVQRERQPKAWFQIALLRDYAQLRILMVTSFLAWFALALLEGTFGQLIQETLRLNQEHFGLVFAYESAIGIAVQTFLLHRVNAILGPKKLLAVCFLLQGLGLALFPFAPNLAWIFVGSTLYGVGIAASNPTISTLSSLIVKKERHGELFGMTQSFRSFGFVVGPTIGGFLFDINHALPYLFAGVVCLTGGVVLSLWRQEFGQVVESPEKT